MHGPAPDDACDDPGRGRGGHDPSPGSACRLSGRDGGAALRPRYSLREFGDDNGALWLTLRMTKAPLVNAGDPCPCHHCSVKGLRSVVRLVVISPNAWALLSSPKRRRRYRGRGGPCTGQPRTTLATIRGEGGADTTLRPAQPVGCPGGTGGQRCVPDIRFANSGMTIARQGLVRIGGKAGGGGLNARPVSKHPLRRGRAQAVAGTEEEEVGQRIQMGMCPAFKINLTFTPPLVRSNNRQLG